jgi:hypothetical protein
LGYFFSLIERKEGLIAFNIPNVPGVVAWSIWVAPTLEASYDALNTSGMVGSPVRILTLPSGSFYRSPSLRYKALVDESHRGFTKVALNLNDFVSGSSTVPMDHAISYFRLQAHSSTGPLVVGAGANAGKPILGPAYVVPPAAMFGIFNTQINLSGKAPGNSTQVLGAPPVWDLSVVNPLPLHVILPRVSNEGYVINNHAGDSLYVANDVGMPWTEAQSAALAGQLELKGNIKMLVLASSTGNAIPFTLSLTMDSKTRE